MKYTTKGSNQFKTKHTAYGLKLKTWRDVLIITGVTTILVSIAMHSQAQAVSDGIVSPLPFFDAQLDVNGIPALSPSQSGDWDEFIKAAHRLAPIYDYPVKVILAQGALESARGTSTYARERFNYFGIGAFDSDPDQAYVYENLDQGIIEYMRFIKARFPEAYEARSNPEKMIKLLKENKMKRMYATDPDYVSKLMRLPEWRNY